MGRTRKYDRGVVLRRAMALFWQRGFQGAHLQDLVEATGLNRFSLYKEFGGKEGLFREALDLYLKEQGAAYAETLEQEPLGFANIRSYFAKLDFPRGYHGCLMINTLTEKHVVSTAAFKSAKRFAQHSEELFLANILAAQAKGEIDPDREPTVLAAFLATVDQGLAIHGIIAAGKRWKNDILAEIDLVLRPLASITLAG